MIGKTRVILGTATPGGGFPAYGWPYAEVLNATAPTLAIEPINTRGSGENVGRIEDGSLDLALATGEVTYEAVNGIGRAPCKNIRIINATYSQAGMFMVRADSPYQTLSDLVGQTVVWGASSSGFVVLARYVMDGLGLDIKKDFDARLLEKAGDGPPMVISGAAAAVWGGGVGWPPFMNIANNPEGMRFIAPSAEEIQRIQGKHVFLKQTTMPAGSYPGQTGPVHSVGSWPFVLARASLPDDIAYRLAKALHTSHAARAARLDQAVESTLANTLAAAPTWEMIHPGVLRFMQEMNLV